MTIDTLIAQSCELRGQLLLARASHRCGHAAARNATLGHVARLADQFARNTRHAMETMK